MLEDKAELEKWELAKKQLDAMPEPQYFEQKELLPIMGYSVVFYYSSKKQVVIFNNKLNVAYARDLGSTGVDFKTAKRIFNS